MQLADSTFCLGKRVAGALSGCTAIACFLLTCGDGVERLSKQLIREGHGLEGYIVDLIGSGMAESKADIVQDRVGLIMAQQGLGISNRYSPGYCSWPVSNQHKLFAMIDCNPGITLTASSLMMPIKSVSGIIGARPMARSMAYPCRMCDIDYCLNRDKG